MLPIPDFKFFVNKFSDVSLPTKAQIFARTGQRAVTPNGVFTRDESARIGLSPTEQADVFAKAAEEFGEFKSDE